jgi:hypothetical protein
VRVNNYGAHFLASGAPIPHRSPEELARQMPASAVSDMLEWGPSQTADGQFAAMLQREFPVDRFVTESPDTPAMQDDRPINEYFLLRPLKRARHTNPENTR